uniref:Gasdermin pore forming domain-containing protein n=1 Tax=Colobus angolensis palliatus TaxID=336983 RepID=A0A2K5IFI3_COLAP
MGSAFERVVRRVVQELDHSRELIPMTSPQNSTGFQPYFLVVRKPSSSRFWKPHYKCVNLSIKDILEPDAPEPGSPSPPFPMGSRSRGEPTERLPVPRHPQTSGGPLCTTSPSAYGSSDHRHLRQPEHKILQELRSRGDNVYVVTEVLQTQKEVEITRTHKREGSGRFSLPGAMCLQGEGQGHLSQKKTVTIPSGSILAFRVAQLVINSDLDILLFPDKKQRTFQPPPTGENGETPAWGVPWRKHASLAIEAFFSCSQGIGRLGSPRGGAQVSPSDKLLLLEQSAPWQERSTMSLPPGLLGSGWGEGAPAWVLLEECGLELGEDTPYVSWEPQAQGRMCALYASLALLSGLSPEPH